MHLKPNGNVSSIWSTMTWGTLMRIWLPKPHFDAPAWCVLLENGRSQFVVDGCVIGGVRVAHSTIAREPQSNDSVSFLPLEPWNTKYLWMVVLWPYLRKWLPFLAFGREIRWKREVQRRWWYKIATKRAEVDSNNYESTSWTHHIQLSSWSKDCIKEHPYDCWYPSNKNCLLRRANCYLLAL